VPSLRQQFGKRLLAIRQERQLTQEQFAELVGISVDFLSLIERGRNAPSFEVLEKLSERLRLPVRDLFDFGESVGNLRPEAGKARRGSAGRARKG
jgi:transcriptional regulator with XRE-family HTH domain